jgi:phosphatidylinositol-binding clathrin assembly protein
LRKLDTIASSKTLELKPEAGTASGTPLPPPTEEAKSNGAQAMIDFFSAIEGEQQQMFQSSRYLVIASMGVSRLIHSNFSPSSSNFQQPTAYNPFQQGQFAVAQPFAIPQIQQPIHLQQTGFIVPQQTGTNPFGQQQLQQPFGGFAQPQQTGFIPPQQTGFVQPQQTGFLVPQATGANPFRQSMLMPQATGVQRPSPGSYFGAQQPQQMQSQNTFQTGSTNPFPQSSAFAATQQFNNPFPGAGQQQAPTGNPFPGLNQAQSPNPFPTSGSTLSLSNQPTSTSPINSATSSNPFPSFTANNQVASPFAQPASSATGTNTFPRSSSVPLASPRSPPPGSEITMVKTHQTGSRNPFGQPVAPAPPVPKVPTLMELALGKAQGGPQGQANGSSSPAALQPQATGFNPGQGSSLISSIASSFAQGNSPTSTSPPPTLSSISTSSSASSPTFSSSVFSSLSTQPTGTTTSSFSPAGSLQPQKTGFSGLKPFKPSSSFGAALLEQLPPIPQSQPNTPNLNEQSKHTPTGSLGSNTLLGSQPTGLGSSLFSSNTVGTGLRPQPTGAAGAANPFRATMFSLTPTATGAGFGGSMASAPTGNAFGSTGGFASQHTGVPNQFGTGASLFGASSGPFSLNAGAGNSNSQQQNGQPSLI